MKKFKINGKEYNSKKFDFNMMCDLEDLGFSIEQAEKKPMGMVRTYFSLCANVSVEEAGIEMENHVISGGKFDEIMEVMTYEMENSDFFRSLTEVQTKETPKTTKTKKAQA